MKLLIVEDDREAGSFIEQGLVESGHTVHLCADGETGRHLGETEKYDVMIVDRMLPRLDGLSMILALRARGIDTPVLILSALGEVDERITGLKSGADDYLTKPYSFAELLARVEVLGRRRSSNIPQTAYETGGLKLDRLANTVLRDGKEINLQPREFRLLEYLMARAGQVVTRTMLLEGVWDLHFDPKTNIIDVHISRLRSKIETGFGASILHTVRGRGYMIRAGK